jgi:hypothetical protein
VPRLDLGAPRVVSAVRRDFHDSAELVAALVPVQLSLPPTSLGVNLHRRRLGTVDSPNERSRSFAGSGNVAALGPAHVAQLILPLEMVLLRST